MMEPTPSLSRVRWLCRRGMLELDRLLGDYAEARYEQLDAIEQQRFVALLGCEDDLLWDWFTGRVRPEDPEIESLVQRIRASL